MKPKKILITGGSGFVGSTLSDSLLEAGHEVTLLLRGTSSRANLDRGGYKIAAGSLSDRASLDGAVAEAEIIFHVAGVISANSREEYFRANAEGTRNLAEAAEAKTKKLERFIYVSSLAAAGPGFPDSPRTEADMEAPVSIYGESKLAGELVLREMRSLPSVVVRPPVVYGPRDRGMLTFFKIVKKGFLPLITGRGPNPGGYSFIHVNDLVDALHVVAFSEEKFQPGEVFFAAEESIKTWPETMRSLAKALQVRGRELPIPMGLIGAIAKIAGPFGRLSGASVALNEDKAKEIAVEYWTCSSKKLYQRTGFKPLWQLDEGFRQTAEWYRGRGWL